MLVAVGVAAQSHSFRDTSYIRYEQYDLDAWLLSDTQHHRYSIGFYPKYPGLNYTTLLWDDILQYNYTDNPDGVKVAGLSAMIFTNVGGTPDGGGLQYPMDPPEYLLLYDAANDTFELKGQLQWEESDTAGRPQYGGIMWVRDSTVIHISDLHGEALTHGNFTLFDLFFDSPITVYDSFYVGGTSRMWEPTGNHCRSGYLTYIFETVVDSTGPLVSSIQTMWKLFHYEYNEGLNIPLNQWIWLPSDQILMVLPIIMVEDTSFDKAPECPIVSGLFTRGSYTETVTVQWAQDSLHQEFELSYGREGTRPEDGTIVTVYDNRWQFTDAAYSDTPMVAYVRTVCREYDTLRWSGWSSPVYFRLHYDDTTHHEGIEVADDGSDLSRFVRLMPNPASGSVVVMSSYGIDRVEVYDVRGERVLEQKGKSHTTTAGFDVTTWAKGVYVVLVYTPAGTAAKRLVVE